MRQICFHIGLFVVLAIQKLYDIPWNHVGMNVFHQKLTRCIYNMYNKKSKY